jgi:hypothetical protein
MANAVYPTYKTVALSPGLDLVTGSTLKACLVSTTTGTTNYTYSAAHQYFSSVPSGSLVAAGVALTGKTVASGALSAASLTWPSVAQSGSIKGEAIIIYNDTGTAGTSQLVAYMDTEGSYLPVVPNGANITLNWSSSVLALA